MTKFAIVAPAATAAGAARLAERCRAEIGNVRLKVGNQTVEVTASFGVANASDQLSPESLIKKADEALYRSKNGGRDQVQFDDSNIAEVPVAVPLPRLPTATGEQAAGSDMNARP